MEIIDLKKAYKAPQAKVIEIKVQSMLCQSQLGENTESFTLGSYSYDESSWE